MARIHFVTRGRG